MKLFIALITCFFVLQTVANSQTIFLTVEGTTSGRYKGEDLRRPDKIVALGVNMEVSTATSSASGTAMPTGRRQYQPLLIRKATGAASPMFLQSLVSNEILKKVTIEFTGINQNGEETVMYVITLENARVIGFKQTTDNPDAVPGSKRPATSALFDEIKLSFTKITVESSTGKTMAADDFRAQY